MAGVLSEDQLLCSICLEVFTDPVTTACGHSFCSICINKHWDTCAHCQCPVCKEEFSSRPQLKTNICLSEMASEFRNKPPAEDTVSSRSQVAGAGDVLCDVCPEPKLKALKSCLVCQTSYCPDHLRPHNTVPRLRKHQLIGPVENLEERLCPEHERLLDVFCRDHCHFMCLQCSVSDHQRHNTVPLKEQCEEEQSELQQKIQERNQKIQELQRSVELSQTNADREMKQGVQFFNDLIKCVQQSLDQFKRDVEQKHQEIKIKAEEFMKELESETSALEQRRAEMEEIWSSEDHFHFVQTFTLDKAAPELNDWTEVFVRAPSYEGRAAVAASNMESLLLLPKLQELFGAELRRAKRHWVDVTVDPDTAHSHLLLSTDRKHVGYERRAAPPPNKPGRFLFALNVLGKERFSSGKFYFEVQVRGKPWWILGVAKESVNRAAGTGSASVQSSYWTIERGGGARGRRALEKVGVFVDYDEGLVCFYDAETAALISSFSECGFTETIVPVLNPGSNKNQDNAAPLTIC